MIDTTKPSLVEGMDFPTYLADPCDIPSLQSSTVKALLETAPAAVWERTKRLNPNAEDVHKKAFDLGTAAHAQLIGGGEEIVVIHHDSYRTKDAKALREAAYDSGLTPVLEADMARVQGMAEAALAQFDQSPDIGWVFSGKEGPHKSEASVFWREAGVACRARPDLWAWRRMESPLIVHYKTTGMTLNGGMLSRFAAGQGWDVTAAHYGAGVKALTGREPEQYFAVQETAPPYLALVCKPKEAALAIGKMQRDRAMRTWARCLRENHWPGHINRTIEFDIPPWYENAVIEAKDAEIAIEQAEGKSLYELSMTFHKPV